MTIGELIAQLRTIQDIFGDLPLWVGEITPAIEVNYRPANDHLPNRAELRTQFEIKRARRASARSDLDVNVSDSAAVGDHFG